MLPCYPFCVGRPQTLGKMMLGASISNVFLCVLQQVGDSFQTGATGCSLRAIHTLASLGPSITTLF